MAAMTFTTTLLQKRPQTPGVATFRFERPPDYGFKPGQWFVITIPSPIGPLTKHFTHSSSPTEGFIEFTTRLTGSEFKNTLDALPLGTEVTVEGPFGTFVLKEGVERVAFLTGGIGVTPVRSILRALADSRAGAGPEPAADTAAGRGTPAGGVPSRLTLFYGNSSEGTVTFADEIDEFERRIPTLRVVHVLSDPPESWSGHRGYIRSETIAAELEDPAAWTFYLSGPPPMVEAMRTVLAEFQVPRRQMVLESFEGYAS